MITEDKVEKALEYLSTSASPYGKWRARAEALDHHLKVAEATEYLGAEGTQEARKAKARASETYKNLVDEYEQAVLEYNTIGSYRKAAELTISVFQSMVKMQSQGVNL